MALLWPALLHYSPVNNMHGSLGHSLPIHSDALCYFLVDTTITDVEFIESKLS